MQDMFRKLRNRVVGVLQAGAKAIGGVLLSKRAHEVLLETRKKAVAELVVLEEQGLKEGVTGVVFSFNRAMQLHATLKSYVELVKNPAPLIVQYACKGEGHEAAYKELEKLFAKAPVKISFVRETKFAETLPLVLGHVATRNLFFLTDDDVFIREVDLSLAAEVNPLETVYSLRLGPHLRRSYTLGVATTPPLFRPSALGDDLLEFDWFEQPAEWSYPYSVEGHVFSTAEIRVLSRLCVYKAPNTYEGALHECADLMRGRKGVCPTHSKLMNLPINVVQKEVVNRAGNVSPEWLLEQWSKGMMLDFDYLRGHTPLSIAEEQPVRLKPRPKKQAFA